ncbi:MAG: ABC transporter permease, partial [Brevefilum sp.]
MKRFFENLKQYPSAIFGSVLILFLVALSFYTVITIPYQEAISQWRGGEGVREEVPKTARPIYFNWFTAEDLPNTRVLDTAAPVDGVEKEEVELSEDLKDFNVAFTFDYDFDAFPQEMQIIMTSEFQEKAPFATLTWIKPDGTEIDLGDIVLKPSERFRFQDQGLRQELGGLAPEIGLFAELGTDPVEVQKGTYELHVDTIVFEEDAEFDAKFIQFGQVHGLAGTDHRRRELSLALLWGAPIALSFGLLAALGTTFTTMFIAAVGVWFGGWVDEIIQRLTEINMLLPFLPFLIMVGTFYSRSIWAMLGVVILLSIFGASIKNYRAIFLQI